MNPIQGTLQAHNELIVNASITSIWKIITDIKVLHMINPGVIEASGCMDTLGQTRTCVIDNRGKRGTMTERLIEMVPPTRTIWTIESDTMGMSSMLSNTKFVFTLRELGESQTLIVSQTYYEPRTIIARVLSRLVLKKMISTSQSLILNNIKNLSEG